MGIRSTAKAIIVDNGRILLNLCHDEHNGDYYSLPGGGQHQYETIYEALVRECREETGYTVKPLRFAALCEEICLDPYIRERYPEYAHKMLHIFLCGLESPVRQEPTEKDDLQVACEWVPLGGLPGVRLLPRALGEQIGRILADETPVFLGSDRIAYNHG